MDPLLIEKRAEIEALCRAYGVQHLYVFGSAATGTRRPDSDFDFSVEFASKEVYTLGGYYFSLLMGLEDLLLSRIDLVVEKAQTNPYFIKSLEESKRLLYASTSEVVSA